MNAGRPDCQTRPGSPTPDANVDSRVSFSNSVMSAPAVGHTVTQRRTPAW
jgi:hypothetical protein